MGNKIMTIFWGLSWEIIPHCKERTQRRRCVDAQRRILHRHRKVRMQKTPSRGCIWILLPDTWARCTQSVHSQHLQYYYSVHLYIEYTWTVTYFSCKWGNKPKDWRNFDNCCEVGHGIRIANNQKPWETRFLVAYRQRSWTTEFFSHKWILPKGSMKLELYTTDSERHKYLGYTSEWMNWVSTTPPQEPKWSMGLELQTILPESRV